VSLTDQCLDLSYFTGTRPDRDGFDREGGKAKVLPVIARIHSLSRRNSGPVETSTSRLWAEKFTRSGDPLVHRTPGVQVFISQSVTEPARTTGLGAVSVAAINRRTDTEQRKATFSSRRAVRVRRLGTQGPWP